MDAAVALTNDMKKVCNANESADDLPWTHSLKYLLNLPLTLFCSLAVLQKAQNHLIALFFPCAGFRRCSFGAVSDFEVGGTLRLG